MTAVGSILKKNIYNKDMVVQLTDEDVKKVQKRLLYLMDDIIKVCDRYDISYQMSGGSCLGAVRHQGFIPWDDDIDINIYRKDVKKFIKYFSHHFGSKYWIHIPGVSKDYDFPFIRIMTKDIRARDIMDSEKEECGLCIDVFIVENVFDNPILRKIQGIGYMGFRYILSCIRFQRNKDDLIRISSKTDEIYKYLRKRAFLGRIFMIVPIMFWTKLAEAWAGICKNSNTEYVSIPAGTKQFFGEMYKRNPFSKSIKKEFEGREVNISADYDTYLSILYKDYMTIPPVEKQERHVMLELDMNALEEFCQSKEKEL